MSAGRPKSELRITGGSLRGRRVPVPRGEVRPTSERARQSYFNIIGDRIIDARFLDLFAGSGIFSLEALSRGAAHAVAVDRSRQNLATIAKLAGEFGVNVETVVGDVLAVIPSVSEGSGREGRRESPLSPHPSSTSLAKLGMTEPFDLVYADPPYDFAGYDDLLQTIDTLPLATGAVVALEHRRHSEPFTVEPRNLQFWRRAEYGEVWITFYVAPEAPGLQ